MQSTTSVEIFEKSQYKQFKEAESSREKVTVELSSAGDDNSYISLCIY